MLAVQKILCPIDFSEPSYQALLEAIAITSYGDAEFILLHVVPPSLSVADDTFAVQSQHAVCDEARKNLDDLIVDFMLAQGFIPENVKVRAIVRQGDVTSEILHAAVTEKCDLIVMATHGATGWREFALGSVTDEIVRLAPCPLLTISESARNMIVDFQSNARASGR